MATENITQPDSTENPSYWESILVASFAMGFLLFVLPIVFGYLTISAEPSGSMFQIFIPVVGLCFACLFGAFGGMISVWHYTKTYDVALTLGKAALIGFLTGVAITLFSTVLDQLWSLIDPNFAENLQNSLISIIESTDMPEAQKQSQIDNIASQYGATQSLGGFLLSFGGGAVVYGLLNTLTGMLGLKLFGKKEETF